MKKIIMNELDNTYKYFFKSIVGFLIKAAFVVGFSLIIFNIIFPTDSAETAMIGVVIGFCAMNLLGFLSNKFSNKS